MKDDVAFKTMVDAANCFGHTYKPKGIWGGAVKHPIEEGKSIWFPKLYKNGEWDNEISKNENFIYERCLAKEKAEEHVIKVIKSPLNKRIVFARVKSPLGDIMYRFKGEYKLNLEESKEKKEAVWKRISERVETYPSLNKV